MMSWWHHWLIISRLKDRLLITRVPSFSASELLGGRGFDGCGLYAPTYSRQSSQRIIPYLEVIVPVLMKFVKSEDDELKESCLQVSNFLYPPPPSLPPSLPSFLSLPLPLSPSLSPFLSFFLPLPLLINFCLILFRRLKCWCVSEKYLLILMMYVYIYSLCVMLLLSLSLSLSFFR